VAVLLLTAVSHVWHKTGRDQIVVRAEILTDIQKRLHLFDKGYFGEGEPVISPGPSVNQLPKRLDDLFRKFGFNLYNVTTFAMAMLTLAVIWTR
jgi:hypothetical protein